MRKLYFTITKVNQQGKIFVKQEKDISCPNYGDQVPELRQMCIENRQGKAKESAQTMLFGKENFLLGDQKGQKNKPTSHENSQQQNNKKKQQQSQQQQSNIKIENETNGKNQLMTSNFEDEESSEQMSHLNKLYHSSTFQKSHRSQLMSKQKNSQKQYQTANNRKQYNDSLPPLRTASLNQTRLEKRRKIIKGAEAKQRSVSNSFSLCYGLDDKLKKRSKRPEISVQVLGGYDIVDYTSSLNQLHKKLLSKISLAGYRNNNNTQITTQTTNNSFMY